MTGHKGNSEFCFPENLHVPRGEAEGNIEVEGKQNSLFPDQETVSFDTPVIKCFVTPPTSSKNCEKIVCFYAGWLINFPRFQGARPDHVCVESSSCCFSRELVSFVRPKELVSFDPRHMTRSPRVGRYNIRRGFKSSSKPQVQ